MSPSRSQFPSYAAIIADQLRSATGPVPVAELGDQMLAAHPSPAKNPQRAMRQHLHQAVGHSLVFLDPDTVLPLRLAFQGARFRLTLDHASVSTGLVPLGDNLRGSYLPQELDLDKVRLIDAAGQPILFQTQKQPATWKSP